MNRPSFYKKLWVIAYPLIIMNASYSVMQFVDRQFLASRSTISLAAALPGGMLIWVLFSFFIAIIHFSSSVIAQYNGRKDMLSCAGFAWNVFFLALVFGIICSCIMPFLGDLILDYSGHSVDMLAKEREYFWALTPSGSFNCVAAAFCCFFSGLGRTWTVTLIHIAASLLNIVLDYSLIFGNWGMPELGITGAGLATSIATMFAAVAAMLIFFCQNQKKYPTRDSRVVKLNFPEIKRLLRFGGPAGIQQSLGISAYVLMMFFIGNLGKEPMAAVSMVMAVNIICMMPMYGMSRATSILSAKFIGEKSLQKAEKCVYDAWRMTTIYMVVSGLILLCFSEFILLTFTPETTADVDFEKVMAYGKILVICFVVNNIFEAVHFTFLAGLRGAGDTKIPMWIDILFAWFIMVPGLAYIVFILRADVTVVWMFFTAYILCLSMAFFIRYQKGSWKKMELIEDLENKSDKIKIPLGEKACAASTT